MNLFTRLGILLDDICNVIIPRFVTQTVLVQYEGEDEFRVVGVPEELMFEDIPYDDILLVKYFKLFYWAIGAKFYAIDLIEEE